MKNAIQRAGRFLSGMIMPNIGAFIAWGLITALFIATGWIPNEKLATLVGPMLNYLLPVLIGYTGGKIVGGKRGAVVGAIATMGCVVGGLGIVYGFNDAGDPLTTDIPMFLGAMIAGPIGGLCIKWFDRGVQGKIKAGFEMLVDNFSAGIIGGILAIFFFLVIAPVMTTLTLWFQKGANFLAAHNALPVLSLFVEPGKVLFLNNAINHGVFTPLGIQQVADAGKSIFFMIESNPGPGLGLLVAYWIAGKGMARMSAPGAIIIQFLGGIHEIYFPYVLMNPILIVSTILGNATGVTILMIFHGGLVGPASPGSIFAELMMTPKGVGNFVVNIAAIALSAVVTLVIAIPLLKIFGKDDADLEEAQAQTARMKAESKGQSLTGPATVAAAVNMAAVSRIAFACDAGMGSSAMGATLLAKKIRTAGLTGIEVTHCAVGEIPAGVQLVVTHEELKDRATAAAPQARVVTITNFMAAPQYDEIVAELQEARADKVLS